MLAEQYPDAMELLAQWRGSRFPRTDSPIRSSGNLAIHHPTGRDNDNLYGGAPTRNFASIHRIEFLHRSCNQIAAASGGFFCEVDTVGIFTIPAAATSATISGYFGNSFAPDSSGVNLCLGSGPGQCTPLAAVPEPASFPLLAAALAWFGLIRHSCKPADAKRAEYKEATSRIFGAAPGSSPPCLR